MTTHLYDSEAAQTACPTLETLEAVVNQRLPPEEHQNLLLHLEGCPRCQDLVRDLQHFPDPPEVDGGLLWGSALLVGLVRLPTQILEAPTGREKAYDALAQRVKLWGGLLCPSPDGEELLLTLPVGTGDAEGADPVHPGRLREAVETLIRARAPGEILAGSGVLLAVARGRLAMPPLSEAADRVFEGAERFWPAQANALLLDSSVLARLGERSIAEPLEALGEGWSACHNDSMVFPDGNAGKPEARAPSRTESATLAVMSALPRRSDTTPSLLKPLQRIRPRLSTGQKQEALPGWRGSVSPTRWGRWRWVLVPAGLVVALLLWWLCCCGGG